MARGIDPCPGATRTSSGAPAIRSVRSTSARAASTRSRPRAPRVRRRGRTRGQHARRPGRGPGHFSLDQVHAEIGPPSTHRDQVAVADTAAARRRPPVRERHDGRTSHAGSRRAPPPRRAARSPSRRAATGAGVGHDRRVEPARGPVGEARRDAGAGPAERPQPPVPVADVVDPAGGVDRPSSAAGSVPIPSRSDTERPAAATAPAACATLRQPREQQAPVLRAPRRGAGARRRPATARRSASRTPRRPAAPARRSTGASPSRRRRYAPTATSPVGQRAAARRGPEPCAASRATRTAASGRTAATLVGSTSPIAVGHRDEVVAAADGTRRGSIAATSSSPSPRSRHSSIDGGPRRRGTRPGPCSMTSPSTRSVATLPPRRGPTSTSVTGTPARASVAGRDQTRDPATDDEDAHPGAPRLVHQVDQPPELVRVGRRQHAVAQVEHVARAAAVLVEDPARGLLDAVPRAQQQHRVKVPLDGASADQPAALGQRDPPVEPDDVATGRRLEPEDPTRPGPEVGHGHAQALDAVEQPPHPRLHPSLVVQRREPADPRVEHLERLGACLDLRAQVRDGRVDQPVQQRGPGRGLGVHQGLGPQEVAGRPAFHEVAGERERRPREPDQGHRRRGADQADRLEQRRHRGLRLERRERLHVGQGPDRALDDRAATLDDVEPDPEARERRGDVGEQDRGVDAEPRARAGA